MRLICMRLTQMIQGNLLARLEIVNYAAAFGSHFSNFAANFS